MAQISSATSHEGRVSRADHVPELHGLRHCWASHASDDGLPLLVVAKTLVTPTRAWSRSTTGISRRPILPTLSGSTHRVSAKSPAM